MVEKIAKNIVAIVSIIILAILTLMSLLYVSTVKNFFENVFINLTTSIGLAIYLLIGFVIIILSKFISSKINVTKVTKKIILVACIIAYTMVSIKWVNNSTNEPIDDSKSVNNLAICFANGDIENIKNSGYIEKYPNQIGSVLVIGMMYKCFKTTNYRLIQYINIASNIITFIFMLLILKELEKKYKVNKVAYTIMTLTFIPLILLTTYVYGDYIGLAFSTVGIYFIMNYERNRKIWKLLVSAIFMCLSYITKMNYIIAILAILIYLGLYLIQDIQSKDKKKILQSVVNIIIYILITLMPFSIIKNYCYNKFGYDKEQALPTSVWLYVGMNESYRSNGWYSDLAAEAWENTPLSHTTYPQKVKTRVKDLISHPVYTVKFYWIKTISGWIDPYFQSIWYNVGVDDKDKVMKDIMDSNKYKAGEMYQKALTILIYGGSFIAILKNRKDLTNELILMIIIFIGGVLFHTIWEMKSRYTLPYVIMLIPVSTIGVQYITDIINFKKPMIKRLNKKNA